MHQSDIEELVTEFGSNLVTSVKLLVGSIYLYLH